MNLDETWQRYGGLREEWICKMFGGIALRASERGEVLTFSVKNTRSRHRFVHFRFTKRGMLSLCTSIVSQRNFELFVKGRFPQNTTFIDFRHPHGVRAKGICFWTFGLILCSIRICELWTTHRSICSQKLVSKHPGSSLATPWFCSFRLWRFINHLLTYLLTYLNMHHNHFPSGQACSAPPTPNQFRRILYPFPFSTSVTHLVTLVVLRHVVSVKIVLSLS